VKARKRLALHFLPLQTPACCAAAQAGLFNSYIENRQKEPSPVDTRFYIFIVQDICR